MPSDAPLEEFDMMMALTSAITDEGRRSRALLMSRVVVYGWDVLSVRWANVLARRLAVDVDELMIGVDIDLAGETP